MLDDNENTTTPATSPDGPPGGAGTPPDSPESSARPEGTADAPGDVTTGAVPPADGDAAGAGTDAADAGTDAAPAPARRTAKKATAKKAAKRPARKSAATEPAAAVDAPGDAAEAPADGSPVTAATQDGADQADAGDASARPAKKAARKSAKKTSSTTAKKTGARKSAKKAAAASGEDDASGSAGDQAAAPVADAPAGTADEPGTGRRARRSAPPATSLVFQAPDPAFAPTAVDGDAEDEDEDASVDAATVGADDVDATPVGAEDASDAASDTDADTDTDTDTDAESAVDDDEETDEDEDDERGGSESGGPRRRRRRGGRRRRRSGGGGGDDADSADGSESSEGSDDTGSVTSDASEDGSADAGTGRSGKGAGAGRSRAGSDAASADDGSDEGSGSRRRRRRRRTGEDSGNGGGDDPQNTTTRVRKTRTAEDEITSLQGSTRLEAKKQRRREGREAGRRRAPIVSEAEFLARREAVDRVMVIRQHEDLTQIAVLEDKVLVEHYVARESQTSLIGNVYLGRVQNVLPSMEAAFIDIGKGRNAVLYAGEVNWDSLGAGNGPRKIEQVLKSGQPILVQVTKDPIGHKGARLTSQVSLPGRFLVYVPDGTTSGISRKLPDTERSRLKTLLKEIVPESAGVIVRTAAEGASEEELTRDVERLTARWSDIESKVEKGNAPALLYGEPDLTLKVVRDLFTEDFGKLVVSGDDAWDMVDEYVKHVAPELEPRLEHYSGSEDVFAAYRIDEQIAKGLDRKVWLPSGGSLIIDRTEAMTVVDVNTGKFTGSGGNLEETVTKNNLEAAEEIVRQLRLRDIGGIIVVDFIDMVLESNRDLVLRRLVECLGRDRTRHQVAEVTSLGLVQMTRKRIGTGLLEAFSETCEHCGGRGLIVHHEPVESRKRQEDEPRRGRRNRRGGDSVPSENGNGNGNGRGGPPRPPSPADLAAMAKHESKQLQDDLAARDGEPDGQPDGRFDSGLDLEPIDAPEGASDGSTVDGVPDSTVAATTDAGLASGAPAATEGFDVVRDADAPAVSGGGADGAGSAEPSDSAASDGAGTSGAEAGAESVGEPVAAPVQPAVPAGPRLVTSRRRVARRPAGPPVGADGADSGPVAVVTTHDDVTADAQDTSADDLSVEEANAAETAHVPVKKKGGRKH